MRVQNGRSPLHAACRKHDRRFIELLLSFKSTDVNALMKNTLVTPLHILARDGDVELCDLLIRHGATVDCKTSHGETPLHFACRDAHVGVVKLLIRQGADFMAQVNVVRGACTAICDCATDHAVPSSSCNGFLCTLFVKTGALSLR